MIKEGQIYREKEPAFFRDKCDIFVITYNYLQIAMLFIKMEK